ncbi:glycosyltransferase [Halogranum rubrum]|uniref:Glycosyltransferase n=1 Tax=Halogranum salarium B-1 TaxID=1210908 RepID=J3JI69_9EURY|nr:glycosyltransferase [Halogranum salarium]EJN61614.1 glycosyltransferase [Halogranum salarium B-1]
MDAVAAFTDTYLPTVNGVTYTVKTWRDTWLARGGRMDVVYPGSDDYGPDDGEFPVRSLPFPFYEGFRLGMPRIPDDVENVDVVHAHTPFALGLSGLRLARREDLPFVTSYHTPTGEYAAYLTSITSVEDRLEGLSERYERWFFDHADTIITPSAVSKRYLLDTVGVDAEVTVISNGVDIDRFSPVDAAAFREKYDLSGLLVGYTGRHGFEKCLGDVVDAVAEADIDATLVFGGDGPARESLEQRAENRGVDARFLGFLPREELSAFYSSLDAFLFPSPVETQGLVALEANACGTPVVGVDSGALADTVDDGVTGYHFAAGDVEGFAAALRRTLAERERLRANCLDRREQISVDHAVDELADIYERVR